MTPFNQWRKEVEDRLGKATPGPWLHSRHGCVVAGPMIEYTRGSTQSQIAMFTGTEWMPDEQKFSNADLAAHAPSDLTRALAEIDKRDGEIKRLEARIEEESGNVVEIMNLRDKDTRRISSLEAANAKMREALEFYGEMNNWNGMDHVSPGPMFTDMCGVRARQALHDAEKS